MGCQSGSVPGTDNNNQEPLQPALWEFLPNIGMDVSDSGETLPETFLAFQLDEGLLRKSLAGSDSLSLPLPDSTFMTFTLSDSGTMSPGLRERFPDIRSYKGVSTETNRIQARIDINQNGFFSMITGAGETSVIGPYVIDGQTVYLSFYRSAFKSTPPPRFAPVID